MKINSLTRIALPTFAMVPLLFAACESKVETRPATKDDVKAERLRDRADKLDDRAAKLDAKSEPRAERVEDRK